MAKRHFAHHVAVSLGPQQLTRPAAWSPHARSAYSPSDRPGVRAPSVWVRPGCVTSGGSFQGNEVTVTSPQNAYPFQAFGTCVFYIAPPQEMRTKGRDARNTAGRCEFGAVERTPWVGVTVSFEQSRRRSATHTRISCFGQAAAPVSMVPPGDICERSQRESRGHSAQRRSPLPSRQHHHKVQREYVGVTRQRTQQAGGGRSGHVALLALVRVPGFALG